VHHERIYPLYKKEILQLRNQTRNCKVAAELREDCRAATRPNQIWVTYFRSE
jgi:hypothetical protein